MSPIHIASCNFFILTYYYCFSVVKLCPTLHDPMHPGFPVFHYLPEFLKFMSTESVMPSYHLILCRPLLLLPSIFPSIRVFSNESVLCTRWPKYWSFSFSISPSNEYSGLIALRIGLVWSPCSPRDSLESSPAPKNHQFFGTQSSLWPNSHIHTWLLEKPQFWLYGQLLEKWCLCFLIHGLDLS